MNNTLKKGLYRLLTTTWILLIGYDVLAQNQSAHEFDVFSGTLKGVTYISNDAATVTQ